MFCTQRIASKRNEPQGKANRAAHHRGFLDVFSHQTQGTARHCAATHRKAAQRIAKQIGLAIGNSGFPDVFSHQLQTASHGIALQSNEAQGIAKHPGLGIRKSAFARSF